MNRTLVLLLAGCAALLAGPAGGLAQSAVDCRFDRPAAFRDGEDVDSLVTVFLPDADLFSPLLADMKQPRFYASYRRVKFRGNAQPGGQEGNIINAGVVALGGTFGLWGRRRSHSCDGYQVGITAGIFSQFNLNAPSADLINTDFIVGLPITHRRGAVSTRFRLYHQSSHLGDEFLLNNPDIDRLDLSFEATDLILSLEGRWWRVYGGGGYLIRSNPDLEPGMAQWGLELHGWSWLWRRFELARLEPVLGVDFNVFEEREWSLTTSFKGGLELSSPIRTHRLRVLFVFLRGFIPFGQFFNTERLENFGFEMQFEL